MATQRYFVCSSCNQEQWAWPRLFDLLHDVASNSLAPCSCGGNQFLKLIFDWGQGVGPYPCKVLGAFLPKKDIEWESETGNMITFYPFLIITEGLKKKDRGVWLPYWHIEKSADGQTYKYGQWAPHMDSGSFADLLGQAKAANLQ